MDEQISADRLSEVLRAVSDVTRRTLLTILVQQGATRVTDLATHYDMSLNAISKHIKVLERAGLVTRRTEGRIHWIAANLDPVLLIDEWFAQLRSIWDLRLEKLNNVLETGDERDD